MKRVAFHLAVGAILLQGFSFAQQPNPSASSLRGPESGTFTNRVYANEFLGLSFSLPAGWEVYGDVSNGEVKAEGSGTGGLILLVVDQHPGGSLRNRIVVSALDGKYFSGDTRGFVEKMVGSQLSREGMSLIRDAFPVDLAGQHFFREDYKESANGVVAWKTFVCAKFRAYFIGWTIAAASQSELEKSIQLLDAIQFRDETNASPEAGALAGTVPGDQPGIIIGVISSTPRSPAAGLPQRIRVSQRVSQGLLIKKTQPQYPEDARQNHIQGQVVLQALIDVDGNMETLTLVSGDPILATAAIEAVKQWKYKPYLLAGHPVKVDTQIVVNFELSIH